MTTGTAMSLSPEVWLCIADFTGTNLEQPCRSTMAKLARVNRYLHGIFEPRLYTRGIRGGLPQVTIVAAAYNNLHTLRVASKYGADLGANTPLRRNLGFPSRRIRRQAPAGQVRPSRHGRFGLLEPGQHASPLHMACVAGCYDAALWLIQQGVDIESPGTVGCPCRAKFAGHTTENDPSHDNLAWTPLHVAICYGHNSVAKLLLSSGASPHNLMVVKESVACIDATCQNVVCSDDSQITDGSVLHHDIVLHGKVSALHTAAEKGQSAFISELIRDTGLDIEGKDSLKRTPICYAVLSVHAAAVIHQLLSLGADARAGYTHDLSQFPSKCQTPFDWSLWYGCTDAAVALLRLGNLAWQSFPDADTGLCPSLLKNAFATFKKESARISFRPQTMASIYGLIQPWLSATRNSYQLGAGHADVESEIRTAFFHALQTESLPDKILEVFRLAGQLDLHCLEPMLHYFDAELGLLGFPRDAAPECVSIPCGMLALCFVVGDTRPVSVSHIRRRVQWLLERGARSFASAETYHTYLPLVCLFTRMREMVSPDGSSGTIVISAAMDRDKNIAELVNVVRQLAASGGWNYDPDSHAFGWSMSIVLDAYLSLIKDVCTVSSSLAQTLHLQIRDTMPEMLQELAEESLRASDLHRLSYFTDLDI